MHTHAFLTKLKAVFRFGTRFYLTMKILDLASLVNVTGDTRRRDRCTDTYMSKHVEVTRTMRVGAGGSFHRPRSGLPKLVLGPAGHVQQRLCSSFYMCFERVGTSTGSLS